MCLGILVEFHSYQIFLQLYKICLTPVGLFFSCIEGNPPPPECLLTSPQKPSTLINDNRIHSFPSNVFKILLSYCHSICVYLFQVFCCSLQFCRETSAYISYVIYMPCVACLYLRILKIFG